MKRLSILLLLILTATAAFAFDTTKRGTRIGVLTAPERYEAGPESALSASIGKYLREELQKSGFDAFQTNVTYDELSRNATVNADYYIEVTSSDSTAGSPGGIGVGSSNVGVDISVVVARVAAEVRLYDGRTLELVHRFELSRSKKGIAPTSISIGVPGLFGWIAIPITEIVQFRRAAHEIARDAASQVAEYRQAD